MKKKLAILVLAQAVLTLLQVFLVSKISLIGKIAIPLAYREYKFLRSGWKTFSIFFGAQILVILVLYYAWRRLTRSRFYLVVTIIILTAVTGLWYSYYDFNNNFSHRLLKERFHLGIYLLWIGMIASAVFFAVLPRPLKTEGSLAAADAMTLSGDEPPR